MRLRSHLVALVVVAVLPVLVFAVTMLVVFGRVEREDIEVNLVQTARALSLAVDRELAASIRTLEALATSRHLDHGDLGAFYDQAARALRAQTSWRTVVLLTPSSEQILNLGRPFGSPLPPSAAPELVRQVAGTGRPGVSDLFFGPLARARVVVVQVPVARDGRVRYVLGAVINPETLTSLLRQQQVPPDWRAAILDRRKIIVARNTGDMVGEPAAPRITVKSAESEEGAFQGVTRDGVPTYTGFRRSALSGWTVVIGAPVAVVEAPLRRTLWIFTGGGLLLLLSGAGLAVILGRRIAAPMRALSASAVALASADPPVPIASTIREVGDVARALEEAGALLQRETDRRDQVQKALRETNEELDALIRVSPAAIVTVDRDGLVTRWNPAAERIFGWDRTEVLGRRLPHADGDARDELQPLFERGLAGETLVNVEAAGRTKRGAPMDASVSLAPLHDPAGRLTGVMALVIDVTERKRAEETTRAIARVGHELVETLDLATATDRIVAAVFERFRPLRAVLYRFDTSSRSLVCVAAAGEAEIEPWLGRALGPGEGLASLAIEERRPVWSEDVLTDRRLTLPPWLRERIREEGQGSLVAAPLVVHGNVLGALALAYARGHVPAEGDFRLLTAFADQAAGALDKARLYGEAIEREREARALAAVAETRARRLTMLNALSKLITSAQQGSTVFGEVAEAAVELLGARIARVWVADPEARVLRALGSCGVDAETERRLLDAVVLPYGSGVPGRIFESGQPEYITDSHDDPRWVNARYIQDLGLHGYAGLPLIAGGRVTGVLSILFKEAKAFSEEEREIMGLLAGNAAIAINNVRLYDDAERRRREAETLADLARDIGASLDLDVILQRAGERARQVCHADLAWIALREPGSRAMVLRHWSGTRHDGYGRIRIEPGQGLGGQVLVTGRPCRTDNYVEDPRLTRDYHDLARAEGIIGALAVPIPGDGGIEGLLCVQTRRPRRFTNQDEAVLTRLAAQAAIAINNARLHEQEGHARAAAEASRELLRRVSTQLVEAQEAERRHLARELHDEIGQVLTGLKLTLEASARQAPATVRSRLDGAQAQINELMVRVRELSLDLRPTMLDDLGLLPALLWHFGRYTDRTGIAVAVKHTGVEGRRFPPAIETAAYRIVQESLTNVARHSGAASATVRVWADETALALQIEDAGVGFDPSPVGPTAGLTGMRERARSLGGQLTIESLPGAGARVTAELPLERE